MTARWSLSPHIDLCSDRIPTEDGQRQLATANEICKRLSDQPGVILADDVGMGKTFVALAVAASVVQSSRDRQVVVMVPSAVGDKWPKDWTVFRDNCLKGGPEIRATAKTITSGSEFLKALDDPAHRRAHIIFLSHRALSSRLGDPFVKLAFVRAAFLWQRSLSRQRTALPRWASKIFSRGDFTEGRVEALMKVDPSQWQTVWNRLSTSVIDDDPVPAAILHALRDIDLSPLRDVLESMPLKGGAGIDQRLKVIRQRLDECFHSLWHKALEGIDVRLPLLILDEAHHLKNVNKLRGLFDNGDEGSEASVGAALGGVFERMLLLTATPFQLGHSELISVLGLFGTTRMTKSNAEQFKLHLSELGRHLDAAQAASLRLERTWAGLVPDDVADLPERWWHLPTDGQAERIVTAAGFALASVESLDVASAALRPWVIRHSKDRRRQYLPGQSTLPDAPTGAVGGLQIEQGAVLPFLLAARAQAYVSMRGLQENKKVRALFADGLASSFEAYLATRLSPETAVVDDDGAAGDDDGSEHIEWYLNQIAAALPSGDARARAGHPKINATVARALHHWREGEKVLVFCFYRATGRALREHLSTAVGLEIAELARRKFGIEGSTIAEVFLHLGERADSLLRRDRPGGQRLQEEVRGISRLAGLSDEDGQALADVTLRFMRTPSLLTRYVDLNQRSGDRAVAQSLASLDGSGLSLGRRIQEFAERVQGLTLEERLALWDGLLKFRTGSRQVDSLDFKDDPEMTSAGVMLLPNVHLANGETDQQLRRQLMTTFNSPFLPEILVASSVMAEGVDLHRECRHVIHHDLDWNPSTLEQRTGRVDRLGSKAARADRDILVCEPFVAGTQDEKQYTVVKDRERWFGVLMGGRVPEEEWATDKIAERAALPEALAEELSLDLSVWKPLVQDSTDRSSSKDLA